MNRGRIYLISLDPTIGSEIKKTRPAIIISNNDIGILPLKVIVPVTDWKSHYLNAPWMVKIDPDSDNRLTKESCIDCLQIRSVSEQRFVKDIGFVSEQILLEIEKAVMIVLNFKS
jgi:mRNA interferase MazF